MSSEATAARQLVERPASAPRPPRRRVTRAEVARLAGVSTAVVSYVLNNGPRPVAEQTAMRVREAMKLLDYRPNSSARALRRGTTEILGLIVADSLNPFFTEYTSELVRAAAATGQRLLVADSCHDASTEELVEELVARQVDGLLLASDTARSDPSFWAHARGVPLVLIDCPGPVPGRLTVGSTAEQGAYELVAHLIDVHGFRRIGIIVGESGYGHPDPRDVGWQHALRTARLPLGPTVHVPFSREGGYAGGLELLALDPRPEAIFATSDQLAIGLLRAIHEQGLRIPEDVAVVAFDGTMESEYCWPPLTVARQPLAQMAAAAMDLVRLPLDSEGRHVELKTDVVIRSSCGCPYQPAGRNASDPAITLTP